MVGVRFSNWDYCTMCAVCLFTCAPGLIQVCRAKKTKTVQEFISQSKNAGVMSMSMSMTATIVSSIVIIGYPGEAFKIGLIFVFYVVGILASAPVVSCVYLPVFYRAKCASLFEYVELRFNRNARRFFSAIYIFRSTFSSSLVIYTAALSLNQASGLTLWISVILVSAVCIIYSSLVSDIVLGLAGLENKMQGGFKAVVITDMLQLVVMVSVILLLTIKGYSDQGGFSVVWEKNAQGNQTLLPIDIENEITIWPYLLGLFIGIVGGSMRQSNIQRWLASATLRKAQSATLLGHTLSATMTGMMMFLGMCMYAKYSNCDPVLSGQVKTRDQASVLFAVETLRFADGLIGIYFAGIICSSISTLSSHLNSAVSLAIEDFVKPTCPNLSVSQLVKIAKGLGLVYGCTAMALVFVIKKFQGIMVAFFVIQGMFSGPLLGLFTVGMFFPWTSTLAALLGCSLSMIFIGWLSLGKVLINLPPYVGHLTTIDCNVTTSLFISNVTQILAPINLNSKEKFGSYFILYSYNVYWYTCWSTLLAIILALVATPFLGSHNPDSVSPHLISPFMINIIQKMSPKWKKRLGFDAKNSEFFREEPNKNNTQRECIPREEIQVQENIPLNIFTSTSVKCHDV